MRAQSILCEGTNNYSDGYHQDCGLGMKIIRKQGYEEGNIQVNQKEKPVVYRGETWE